jgi:hypothetical protein
MEKLQSLLKKSTPDRAGDEMRQDEITPYSPPAGDEGAGSPECEMCLGEGRVPVFKDQDGLSMPVGYKQCDCIATEDDTGAPAPGLYEHRPGEGEN